MAPIVEQLQRIVVVDTRKEAEVKAIFPGAFPGAKLVAVREKPPAVVEETELVEVEAGDDDLRNDPSLDAGIRDQLQTWEPRLLELGWPARRLWGQFWPNLPERPRGLASVLQPGDRLVSADDKWIHFIRRNGTSGRLSEEG
jgi:hypothetical protein